MKLMSMTLQHKNSRNNKEIKLDNKQTIIYSKENGTGKTTLMRAILYTFGFPIPNTELVKFNDFEFSINVIKKNKKYKIIRKKQLLVINDNEYDLPVDQASAHAFLFDNGNNEIITNILGTIYFDQEKGWTLLNRGKIIGDVRFGIESFFRGLKGDESDDSYRLVARINAIENKIKQYKLMTNVSEYQESANRDIEKSVSYNTYEQKIDEEMLVKKIKLQKVEDEISSITDIINKNKNFSDFIIAKKIFVINPIDQTHIRVTKSTLFNYSDTEEINLVRKNRLITERSKLKKEIFEREQEQVKEELLFDLTNVDEELTKKFSTLQNISSVQVKIMLEKFQKEKKELKEILKKRTGRDNDWVNEAFLIISKYSEELKIPVDYRIDIFTSNLKEKSGAILHKMVFIYKLAYIKLLSKKLGYSLPIFLDSPSGREVERNTIIEMLNIIKRDFSSHQIIIASINDFNDILPDAYKITMDKTLFDEETLFD